VSYPQQQTAREIRSISCFPSAVWGAVLVLSGIVALLPEDLSRYAWSAVAIVAGLWLLAGPVERRRDELHGAPSARL